MGKNKDNLIQSKKQLKKQKNRAAADQQQSAQAENKA